MTLDEAIKHAQDVADTNCGQCAEDHKQLAEWLKELKELKEQGWHPASELPSLNKDGNWYHRHFDNAQDVCTFLNENGLMPGDFVLGKCSTGATYTILYYSDKYLY
ncbi:hypothetical protein [Lachnospira sp.]|jgi:hypothetical protein|uniref:hypothetical protein n=1 Tax=Lachnospira sp. TaxID=2049031 RepID=UPI00257D7B36|nr:hypothetical protein [Lachnospira sp.]